MASFSEIKQRAKELAGRMLDGGSVKPSEWATLAGEQLQTAALEEARIEREKRAQEEAMRTEYARLIARALECQQTVNEVHAKNEELLARESARQMAAISLQADVNSGNYETAMAALRRAPDQDAEYQTLLARQADEREGFTYGRKYNAALSERNDCYARAKELQTAALAVGIKLG